MPRKKKTYPPLKIAPPLSEDSEWVESEFGSFLKRKFYREHKWWCRYCKMWIENAEVQKLCKHNDRTWQFLAVGDDNLPVR